jgi:hypothetical protein
MDGVSPIIRAYLNDCQLEIPEPDFWSEVLVHAISLSDVGHQPLDLCFLGQAPVAGLPSAVVPRPPARLCYLEVKPKNIAIRTELASCLYYAGDVDGALRQLSQATTDDPKDANSLFNLGMIRWKGITSDFPK